MTQCKMIKVSHEPLNSFNLSNSHSCLTLFTGRCILEKEKRLIIKKKIHKAKICSGECIIKSYNFERKHLHNFFFL